MAPDARASGASPLPEFEAPPVAEVAIGVVFLPIPGWQGKHFVRFGRQVQADYPIAEPQPATIATQLEQFGPAPRLQILAAGPSLLWWYADESNRRLIQLQPDRFVHNWRKQDNADVYPRYKATREVFATAWSTFVSFLAEQKLPAPQVLQVEMDYVNHLDQGTGLSSPVDLPNVTPLLGRPQYQFLPNPEGTLVSVRYLFPENRGRLHFTLQPAIRNVDKAEIIQLTLQARGRPKAVDRASILEWCDLAHEWIVRGFTDLTTPQMHETWRRVR